MTKSFCNHKITPHYYWLDKYIICSEFLLFAPGPFSYVGFNFGYTLMGYIASLLILCGAIMFAIRWYRLSKSKSDLNVNTLYLAGLFALLFFVYTTAFIGLIGMSYNAGIKSISTNNHTFEVAYWFYLAALLFVTDIIVMIIYCKRHNISHF